MSSETTHEKKAERRNEGGTWESAGDAEDQGRRIDDTPDDGAESDNDTDA